LELVGRRKTTQWALGSVALQNAHRVPAICMYKSFFVMRYILAPVLVLLLQVIVVSKVLTRTVS